ncbi:Gfo/Idh/MocA family protein [Pelagovum pacificum]|uniref:Gfo/Idh/MocA family oxidoreductase n=1 Tax=Pelagovum pacificum TaxID=2588711 RepID=A0A5C5GHU4_9RHOB|nr:Gfo/Idh/MocA family oxidoreductase [Pelagovum pacificum]QQA43170.1 Gfo/Idh/MocA family oxidoreductase [Pelagovum pacificum]TNY33687.1 Gfo/Idh/MocA family oxidoreductase [Pelagovum pacificum]
MSTEPLSVLVVGLGQMGRSHALAYHAHPGYKIVGLVNRSTPTLPQELSGYPVMNDFMATLDELKPDVVSISTHTNTHADFAVAALEAGAHVFVEKPLAANVADAERVVAAARANDRKLVVGYILRHHPSWMRLIEESRKLGGPFVFRMNLNQQSSGAAWGIHKSIMQTTSPIVDCGVHYVDVMCQITDSRPVEVRGMGTTLAKGLPDGMYNYGQFQVLFEDGSSGWYEAAWGPMISETAYFVKDVMSPNGAVSIVMEESAHSADINAHTQTSRIRVHHAEMDGNDQLLREDEWLDMSDEPGHQDLCDREQDFLYRAITEGVDLDRHMTDAVASLHICLAADESIRTGKPIRL